MKKKYTKIFLFLALMASAIASFELVTKQNNQIYAEDLVGEHPVTIESHGFVSYDQDGDGDPETIIDSEDMRTLAEKVNTVNKDWAGENGVFDKIKNFKEKDVDTDLRSALNDYKEVVK